MRPALLALFTALLLLTLSLPHARVNAQETPSASPASESPSPAPTSAETPFPVPSESPKPSPGLLPLVANPSSVQSNIGVSRDIAIAGASGALTATMQPRAAAVTIAGSTITISPIINGRATLHVVDSAGASVDVPVRIAPNAGSIPKRVLLKLTGATVEPDFIAAQATLALRQSISANPGTTLSVAPIAAPANPLGVGGVLDLSVPVSVLGGDQYLDVDGTTQLNVQNVAAAPFEPTILYYSDDPEHIVGDGVLFRGTVSLEGPVRIYDYHENGAAPRRLVVALRSSSMQASTVHVVEAFAGPNIDVMSVGHAASKNFLISKPRDQGVILDLTESAPFFQRDVLMGSFQGVASVADFRVLAGGPVTITVLAVSPNVSPASLLDGAPLTGDGKGRHGTFSLSQYGTLALQYAVGAQDASLTVGDREPTVPKAVPTDPGADFGDYGVLFNLSLTIDNPGDASQVVYLYEAPRGGPVRATFLIDNASQPTELGCATSAASATSPPRRYLIAQFDLPPRATQTHRVRTLTDGGSNYPIELGLTTQPPQPTTPPISAPDGCFPKSQPSLP